VGKHEIQPGSGVRDDQERSMVVAAMCVLVFASVCLGILIGGLL